MIARVFSALQLLVLAPLVLLGGTANSAALFGATYPELQSYHTYSPSEIVVRTAVPRHRQMASMKDGLGLSWEETEYVSLLHLVTDDNGVLSTLGSNRAGSVGRAPASDAPATGNDATLA